MLSSSSLSLYLKTAIVGKHDNSIPITSIENELLREDNQSLIIITNDKNSKKIRLEETLKYGRHSNPQGVQVTMYTCYYLKIIAPIEMTLGATLP